MRYSGCALYFSFAFRRPAISTTTTTTTTTAFARSGGNQINQGFALLYLDGMDKLIKWELGIEYYGRYMDDFYLIHPSKDYLKYCLEVITAYLETLDLTLNGKTQIFPFKNGVSYLGFHTYITADGKAIRKLKNQNKRNAQRKFVRMAKLVAASELPMEKKVTPKSNIPSDEEIQARIEELELEIEFLKGLLRLNELGRAKALLEVMKMLMQPKYRRDATK